MKQPISRSHVGTGLTPPVSCIELRPFTPVYAAHRSYNHIANSDSVSMEVNLSVDVYSINRPFECTFGGFAKNFFPQNPRLLWKWVGGSRFHSDFVVGKLSQNSPKPVLIFWSSIPCVFCLHCYKLVVIMIWVFCTCQWWVSNKKRGWMGGGLVVWSLSNFIFYFLNLFNFAKPFKKVLS